MSISFVFISLLFIFLSVQSVVGSTHAVVGDYSQLNGKDCGHTKKTPEMTRKCFEWHKNLNPSMKSGRNANIDDVPWLVYIESAETYYNDAVNKSYSVLFGVDLVELATLERWKDLRSLFAVSTEGYRHPNFSEGRSDDERVRNLYFDIGLIKLPNPVDALDHPMFRRVKSICLPERNVMNEHFEYAMTAGWGQIHPFKKPAQLGYRQILPWPQQRDLILANKLDDKGLLCYGDSGGPLWQYSMGRAIIIGVYKGKKSGRMCEGYESIDIPRYPGPFNMSITWFSRVSKHIDWIMNVTQLH